MNMTADALASSSVLKDRVKSGVSLADVEPMNIDKSVSQWCSSTNFSH